jgi:hypothetical protein
VLEWRQDPRRELRRATALDQLDECVQIDPALARELPGQAPVEAGLAQACAAPGDDFGRPWACAGLWSASKVHVCLAPEQDLFLLPSGRALDPLRDEGAWVNAAAEGS